MIKEYFQGTIRLYLWKFYVPIILTLAQITGTTSGTSVFAERNLLLAYCLITWLWLNMENKLFDSLDLMAWYKDELDKIMDLDKVGNEYIDKCKK